MTLPKMTFSPATGLRDTATYPSQPASGAAAREQVQGRMDEIQDYLNDDLTAALDAEIALKSDKYLTFETVTASKTFDITDVDVVQVCDHASVAINLTIPPNSSVDFEVGAFLPAKWHGVAQTAFVAGAGVTINPATKLKINAVGDYVGAVQRALNVWDLIGPTKA